MTPAPVTHVTAGGVGLACHGAGEGADWVFQHGLCGAAAQPLSVAPDGLRTHVLEMRGHGDSPLGPPDQVSIAQFTQDLAGFITAKALGPCSVGGISMGAAIALRLAVLRPDLVRGLVLARPAWVCGAAPENMTPNAEVGALLRSMPPEVARARFAAGPTAQMLAQVAPDNLTSLMGFFDRAPQDETAQLLSRIAADGPGVTEAQLALLPMPVLIIATDHDHIHPMAHAQRLAALIPHAACVEIPSKSRDPQRYATEFRAALAHFLKGL